MASHVIDSLIFKDVFGTEKMREVWKDEQIIQNWLNIEAALAESQAELGMLPKDIAAEITSKAKVELMDMAKIRAGMIKTGHSLVPTLREFQSKCAGKAGESIHLGPTTQDIIDTGLMLSSQKAFDMLYDDMKKLEDALMDLVEKNKHVIMAGRTHGQQALPITFGYKASMWLSEIHRHVERMQESRKRDFVGQLDGAVGTLASFGPQAFELQKRVLNKLNLQVPDVSWAPSRDRLTNVASLLATMAGTMGRIGHEITTLQKTEFSELAEAWHPGMVGSSTMPHKRNPAATEAIQTLAKMIKNCMMNMQDAMIQEHERDGAPWKMEWATMPEIFIYSSAIIDKTLSTISNLVVNTDKMEANLNILKGLLLSEPVMLHLGEKIGKQSAHEVVYEVSMKAFKDNASFKDYLLADERVSKYLTDADLDKILNPHDYIGFSVELCERAIAKVKEDRAKK